MTTLEKLQSDMEDDAYFNLPLQERYDLLKRDAETIAKRLDAVLAMLEPGRCVCACVGELGPKCECSNTGNMREVEAWWTTYCLHAKAVAIAEGRES